MAADLDQQRRWRLLVLWALIGNRVIDRRSEGQQKEPEQEPEQQASGSTDRDRKQEQGHQETADNTCDRAQVVVHLLTFFPIDRHEQRVLYWMHL